MKAWLKGGLIGLVIFINIPIILGIFSWKFCFADGNCIFELNSTSFLMLDLLGLIGFILGVVFVFVIKKIKAKEDNAFKKGWFWIIIVFILIAVIIGSGYIINIQKCGQHSDFLKGYLGFGECVLKCPKTINCSPGIQEEVCNNIRTRCPNTVIYE